MQTKNYTTDLLPLIKSLCGVEFAAIELPRIKAMINSRAKRAYRASNFWPRFLVVGQSRTVTNGYVPWTESGLDSIDTFILIHRTEPYVLESAQDFDFYVDFNGAKITDGSLNSSAAFVTYKKQTTDVYGDGTSGTTTSIPDEWFEYLAHGTYSDWLRAEGQMEKAVVADQEAMDKLTDELIRIDEMRSTALVSTRIQTNANMQSRWSY
jgi:ribosomal protein L25 (general stress protein Ctc)